jgi:hypothetical protein
MKGFAIAVLFTVVVLVLFNLFLLHGAWTDYVPGVVLVGVVLAAVLVSSIPRRVGIAPGEIHFSRWGRDRIVPPTQVVRVDLVLETTMQALAGERRVYEPLVYLANGRRFQIGPVGEDVVSGLLQMVPIDRFWIKVMAAGSRYERTRVLAEYPLSRERGRPPIGPGGGFP